MIRLLSRDFRLAASSAGTWWSTAAVFVLISTIFAIGVGAATPVLSAVAAGVVWSAAILSVMMVAPSIFAADIESGAIDYLRLDGHALWQIALSKLVVVGILVISPLVLTTVLVGELFALSSGGIVRLVTSLVVGGPSLVAYSVFAGALLAGWGRGNLLSLLLTLPLLLPAIIFGQNAATSSDPFPALQALAGLSLVSVVLSVVASAAAIAVNAE